MNLSELLKQLKPNLKEGSIRNYVISLEKIHQRLFDNKRDFENLEWLKEHEKVMELVSDMNANTKRNYLNSVIVFFGSVDGAKDTEAMKVYMKERDDLNKEFAEKQSQNKKSDKQTKNWITADEFGKVVQTYESALKKRRILQAKPSEIEKDELSRLQDYVLLRLYQEIPSRNDFADVKIISKKEYNANHENNTNYLVVERSNMYFILHHWKTKRNEMDTRKIDLAPPLRKLLRAYMRKIGSRTHLFANSRGGPLTRNGLTKLFTRLFKRFYPDKNISTSMMRHVFLTHKYSGVVEEMKEDQKNLGHSADTQKQYIKSE
jgi:integrase